MSPKSRAELRWLRPIKHASFNIDYPTSNTFFWQFSNLIVCVNISSSSKKKKMFIYIMCVCERKRERLGFPWVKHESVGNNNSSRCVWLDVNILTQFCWSEREREIIWRIWSIHQSITMFWFSCHTHLQRYFLCCCRYVVYR